MRRIPVRRGRKISAGGLKDGRFPHLLFLFAFLAPNMALFETTDRKMRKVTDV